uniref:HECT domain-containing protein n=1 Tax=Ascaris lumbricoides TaxID=6252 RepID=A0A0M3IHS2_ASCLU
MYHPVGARQKDVSTRLIKPTLPNINITDVLSLANNWNPSWETDAGIAIYDEGIAQYLLVDAQSHIKFFAALILGKPSLRCRLVEEEPKDVLDDDANNSFTIVRNDTGELTPADMKRLEYLKDILSRRGYRFVN